MATLKVKDIKYEEFMGEMCEIKYVQVYIVDTLLLWLTELIDRNYSVFWMKQHRVILKHNFKSNDYVFVDCKQKINPKDNRIMEYFQPLLLMF